MVQSQTCNIRNIVPEYASGELDHESYDSYLAQISVLANHALLTPAEQLELETLFKLDPSAASEKVKDLYHERWTLKSPLYRSVSAEPHENVVGNLYKARDRIAGEGPFAIYRTDLEENLAALLKMRDVIDVEWNSLKKAHETGRLDEDTIAFVALGKNPNDADYILFTIASYVRKNKSKWHKVLGYLNAVYRTLTLQTLQFRDFGKKTDFCIDLAFIAYYLAASYGIYGDLESGHGKTGMHHIWRELGDSGRIIDVNACPHLHGFVRNPADHAYHEMLGELWKTRKGLRSVIERGEHGPNNDLLIKKS